MSANNWFTRFPPSDASLKACNEVVASWKEANNINTNLEEPTWKLAARVNSWIGPRSVQAGVIDIIGARIKISEDLLIQLAEQLTRRLLADDILGKREVMKPVERPVV